MAAKNSTKKDGERKRYTKDELLDIMNDHLVEQQKFALELKERAEDALKSKTGTSKEEVKARNQYLWTYNQMVEAVSKTSATMIKIYNSSLENGEEKPEDKYDDLVD